MTTNEQFPQQPLLTLKEAAAFLRISVRHLQRIVKRREVACFRFGRSIRLSVEDLASLMESARQPAYEGPVECGPAIYDDDDLYISPERR